MIVLDSSALVDFLIGSDLVGWVDQQLDRSAWDLRAPHLIDIEVLRALRRLHLRGELSAGDARERVDMLGRLPLVRYSHRDLLSRVWELRQNVSAADAAFVALAEALDAPLVTTDLSLARTPGLAIEILSP